MDDQLDDDLKKRIREVFDNYDDTSADEGWLLLRKKFPEEQSKRRAFAWVWWGAAAILLLFLGAGLWIYNNNTSERPQKFALKTAKRIKPANQIASAIHPGSSHKAAATGDNNLVSSANTNTQAQLKSNHPGTTDRVNQSYKQGVIAAQSPLLAGTVAKKPGVVKNAAAVQQSMTDTATNDNILANNQVAVTKNTVAVVPAQSAVVNPSPNTSNPVQSVVKVKPPVKTMADMFAEDNKVQKPFKNTEKEKDYAKRVNFGVYATTYFNYARGSDNQVNAGAGFSSDIRISKNLKLVTGVAIGQNTLSYAGTEQPAAVQQNIAVAASYAAIRVAATTPLIARGYENVADIAAPTFKNYDASLIGLDIPVNLKYEFNPQKNDIYVSAGVSSGTFINESYTYLYSYPSFNSSDAQTKNETTSKSFNSFYFAKTLNFAFGMGYPFAGNRLIIEPFLKYPLDGLGSQQLKFGAGGLNLKFNFEGAKK